MNRIDVQLKNISDLVATGLVMYNMCIIFCDHFWKHEWLREATDDAHNRLAIAKITSSSIQERLAVVNLALHN